jgi:hypothetical protein
LTFGECQFVKIAFFTNSDTNKEDFEMKKISLIICVGLIFIFLFGCGKSNQIPSYDFDESEYKYVPYEDLVRNPDDYIDKPIQTSGTVRFIISDGEQYSVRGLRNGNGDEFDILYEPGIVSGRLIEGDFVFVNCVFLGIDSGCPYGWATKIDVI